MSKCLDLCPECNSPNLELGEKDMYDDYIDITVVCVTCGHKWKESYIHDAQYNYETDEEIK